MPNLSDKSLRPDAIGVLALLEMISDPESFKKRLAALTEAANLAEQRLTAAAANIDEVSAREAIVKQKEADLEKREAALKTEQETLKRQREDFRVTQNQVREHKAAAEAALAAAQKTLNEHQASVKDVEQREAALADAKQVHLRRVAELHAQEAEVAQRASKIAAIAQGQQA